jgi:hypothetical protein
MKNAWFSLLLIGVIACGVCGISRAQSPTDEDAQAEPPPQMRRDLSEIFRSATKNPTTAPLAPNSPMRIETHNQLYVIHPGGHGDQDFSPPTTECAQAISDALNARAVVPAPDQECADLMEKALAVRRESEN